MEVLPAKCYSIYLLSVMWLFKTWALTAVAFITVLHCYDSYSTDKIMQNRTKGTFCLRNKMRCLGTWPIKEQKSDEDGFPNKMFWPVCRIPLPPLLIPSTSPQPPLFIDLALYPQTHDLCLKSLSLHSFQHLHFTFIFFQLCLHHNHLSGYTLPSPLDALPVCFCLKFLFKTIT